MPVEIRLATAPRVFSEPAPGATSRTTGHFDHEPVTSSRLPAAIRARPAAVDPLLKLLRENAALKPAQLASLLGIPEAQVFDQIKAFEKDRVILGYRTVLNEEKLGRDIVRAVIDHDHHAAVSWNRQ